MRMVTPSPQKNPHTIKSDTVYLMEQSLVDVDALVHVVPSTWVHLSLLHVLPSEHCVAKARLCRTRMVDVVNLRIYRH
jgi:hypothetical protein